MSSHREAPEISKDPVADSTDLYAFVSPDKPDTVTLIANYVPLQGPAAGPNFYEFGDDVHYEINISNSRDAGADVTYAFDFTTEVRNEETFLYNTGPISSLDSTNFNRRQFYTVTRTTRGGSPRVLGRHLASPPCNIGPRSTPRYGALASAAVHRLAGGVSVFAGQRAEGFYADLGSIFDLLTLRPFQAAHLIPSAAAMGVNALKKLNVHTIALQVPITDLTRGGRRAPIGDPAATIGVWTAAYRRRSRVFDSTTDRWVGNGAWQQVSRLGNPLINEVIIPMGDKDDWNTRKPSEDGRLFAKYYEHPEVAKLLPVLYPGAFTKLAGYSKVRADLVAILLTGIPKGVVTAAPSFQTDTGPVRADLLRLNTAVAPTKEPNNLGVLGGDLAGFPNGRRLADNVVTIELRALGGLTIPLVDPSFKPDKVASAVEDGTRAPAFRSSFPYLSDPYDGYSVPAA